MDSIRAAFAFNLKMLRGNRTQAEMAEFLGLPLRTYQKIEGGNVPQRATMKQLTSKLGVTELALVQFPGETLPLSSAQKRALSTGELLGILSTLKDDEVLDLLKYARGLKAAADTRRSGPLSDEPIKQADIVLRSKRKA